MMSLKLIKLDQTSRIPLHTQLYQILKNSIQSGQLCVGEKCPTHQELMDTLDVSKSVVQHAFNLLEEQNVVRRQRGKATYIVEKNINLDYLQQIQPMAELIERSGFVSTMTLISKQIVQFNPETMGNLELDPQDKVYEVIRIYEADHEPIAYFVFYYPLKYFPDIERFNFKVPYLTDLIHQKYPKQFETHYRSIFAVNLNDMICKKFKVNKNAVGFKIQNIAYASHGKPSNSTIYYIRGTSTTISIDIPQMLVD